MNCRIMWKRYHLYVKFKKNIWGTLALVPARGVSKKIINFFELRARIRAASRLYKGVRYVYRIDLQTPKKKRKRLKWKYVRRKLTRLFFLVLTHRQASQMALKALRFEGVYESYLLLFLECRLFSIIYRLNLVDSPFLIRDYLRKTPDLMLNGRRVNYFNQIVKLFQILKIRSKKKRRYKWLYKRRLLRRRRKNYLFKCPRFFYFNFKLFFIVMWKLPKRKDFVYPNKSIDMYRLVDVTY